MERLTTTAIDGTLHVMGIYEGQIYHCLRHPDSTWTDWGQIAMMDGTNYAEVACTHIGSDLHVTAVNSTGIIWHTIRYQDGNWQQLGQLPNQPLLGS